VDTLACEPEARESQKPSVIDFESLFLSHYPGVARAVARVVRDHARAEELAVEIFLKIWRNPSLQREVTEAWLYRAALRRGLDELRQRSRRTHYERLLGFVRRNRNPDPEEIHSANEEQERVRRVLASMAPRQAELLLLRNHGLSYEELAAAQHRNAASIGTLLSRAQEAFRGRYIKLYGNNE
jgi:RNA polymerase sigma-70 factor (ECF subfamily)